MKSEKAEEAQAGNREEKSECMGRLCARITRVVFSGPWATFPPFQTPPEQTASMDVQFAGKEEDVREAVDVIKSVVALLVKQEGASAARIAIYTALGLDPIDDYGEPGMTLKCPACGHAPVTLDLFFLQEGGAATKRKYTCPQCGGEFITVERVAQEGKKEADNE